MPNVSRIISWAYIKEALRKAHIKVRPSFLFLPSPFVCMENTDWGSESVQHGVMITFVSNASNPLIHPGWALLKIHRGSTPPKHSNSCLLQQLFVALMFMDDGRFRKPSSPQIVFFVIHYPLLAAGWFVVTQSSQTAGSSNHHPTFQVFHQCIHT